MPNPLELILQQAGLQTPHFAANSRYHGLETAKVETADGQTRVFVRRRFIASPERFEVIHQHRVAEGERPDHLAHQYLGDAEQYWQICDANNVMNPLELTSEIGKTVSITLPEGIPGTPNV